MGPRAVCCSCVLWLCVVVVCCGCVLWMCLCGCVCGGCVLVMELAVGVRGGNTARRSSRLRSGGEHYQPRLAIEDDAEDEKEEGAS